MSNFIVYCHHVGSFYAMILGDFWFFFFKQKTAYEMLRSLVGSEMCIRDSLNPDFDRKDPFPWKRRNV